MGNLTLEDVTEILDEVIDLSGVQVSESSVLGEDIPVDSRQMLRVISRIESRYRIRFTPRDLVRLKTVGDLLAASRREDSKGS